jgi:hypothetical protein
MKRYVNDNIQLTEEEGYVYNKNDEVEIIGCELDDDYNSGIRVIVKCSDGREDYICASLLTLYPCE